ncbi:MAG: flagellar export protein FliJ [Acidimicrobiales bacterium]
MRYRFPLETVRRVRRAEEKVARARLLLANASLVSAIATRDLADARSRATGSPVVDLASLLEERCRAELAAVTLEHAKKAVSRAASEAALAHVAWTTAAKRVATLERLDERRRAEHLVEEGRREVAMVDDMVAARYAMAAKR